MKRNRISAFQADLPRPPQPPAAVSPWGLVFCPPPGGMTVEQWGWQQALYRWAFEQAQAVVRPSLPERDLLAVWN